MYFQEDPSDLLYEAITRPEKKLAFFVGAGVSIKSGLKDFKGFSEQFLSIIGPESWTTSADYKIIDFITERLRPEVLLQGIQQVHGDESLEFFSSLNSEVPNSNHYFLALALLKGHCVFTTNVDTLIEKACENIGVSCTPIFYEEHYRDFLQKQPLDFSSQLFKLHGSIEPKNKGLTKYESIRFTLDRVGLGLGENAGKTLSTCLQKRDFIFLGYSGNDHFSVLPELLRVDSDQKIYWFKFCSSSALDASDSNEFRLQRDNLLKEALKGSSTVNWASIWEDISLRDILIKWEPRSYLFKGDSSKAIEDILNKLISSNETPEFGKVKRKLESFKEDKLNFEAEQIFSPLSSICNTTDFKRHLCAATLLIRARNLVLADSELKHAEEYAEDDKQKAEVERLRATTYSITRRVGKEKLGKDDLYRAMEKFRMQGDTVAAIEANLELVNIIRIERDFGFALEELDKVEKELATIKSELQKQKKAYDWPHLMAYLYFLRGLTYGLGQKGTLKDKILGIEYCDKASEFASQAGDIPRKASILNAKGLIIYQLAERTGIMLQEAENSLNEALALYAKIKDPRSCFQPSRNLLLVHHLRYLRSKSKLCDYWLDKAWEESNRAQNYLLQIKTGSFEPIRDQIELDFRKAQLLWLKGEKDNAYFAFTKILDYWKDKEDLHQQARIWQELLSLAEDKDKVQDCLSHSLSIIELLFQSEKECNNYKNDLLRLENIMSILIDAFDRAYEIKDQEHLERIRKLAHRGKEISELIGDSNLTRGFEIYSSMPLEEKPLKQRKRTHG